MVGSQGDNNEIRDSLIGAAASDAEIAAGSAARHPLVLTEPKLEPTRTQRLMSRMKTGAGAVAHHFSINRKRYAIAAALGGTWAMSAAFGADNHAFGLGHDDNALSNPCASFGGFAVNPYSATVGSIDSASNVITIIGGAAPGCQFTSDLSIQVGLNVDFPQGNTSQSGSATVVRYGRQGLTGKYFEGIFADATIGMPTVGSFKVEINTTTSTGVTSHQGVISVHVPTTAPPTTTPVPAPTTPTPPNCTPVSPAAVTGTYASGSPVNLVLAMLAADPTQDNLTMNAFFVFSSDVLLALTLPAGVSASVTQGLQSSLTLTGPVKDVVALINGGFGTFRAGPNTDTVAVQTGLPDCTGGAPSATVDSSITFS